MSNEKEPFISQLRHDRDSFVQLLARMPDDYMGQLRIADQWTVKDLLAHITAWEKELLRWLEEASKGKSPDIPAPGQWSEYTDLFNNQTYLDNRDRPLKDVLLDFREVYRRLLSMLEALPEDLDDDFWSVWLGGKPAWDLFATFADHYTEHREQIQIRLAIM